MMDLNLLFKNKIGLVLAGGGAKGAYHVGVFQALKELNLLKLVKVVSGTSIGALNGALFLLGDEKLWYDVWQDATFSNFLRTEENVETKERNSLITSFSDIKNVFKKSLNKLQSDWDKSSNLSDFLLKQKLNLFSLKGLSETIDQHMDLKKITDSSISFYACAYNIDRFEPEYFQVNSNNPDKIKKILTASVSIPFMYEPVTIDSYRYLDGGVYIPLYPKNNVDNIPIKPLQDYKCDFILIVYLHHKDKAKYKDISINSKIIEIYPSLPLEEIKGTGSFDFSKSSVEDRMELGYHDAMFIIAPMLVKWLLGNSVEELIQKHEKYNDKLRKKYI